jgi:hypothetical protein
VIDADAAVKLIVVNVAPVAAFGTPELPDDLAIAADRLEPRGLKSWQRDQARLSARATAARAGVQRIRVAVSGGGHGASFPAHTGEMTPHEEFKAGCTCSYSAAGSGPWARAVTCGCPVHPEHCGGEHHTLAGGTNDPRMFIGDNQGRDCFSIYSTNDDGTEDTIHFCDWPALRAAIDKHPAERS